MNELERIDGAVREIIGSGSRGLLVTVVGTRGSTYRRAGARVVIGEDGSACGAISGGCLERDLAERAKAWLDDPAPRVVTYDSSRDDDIVFGLGLGCRGEVEMLVQPFSAARPPRYPRLEGRQGVLFATVIASRNPRYATGDAIETSEAFDRTCRTEIDGCDVLVEVIRPQTAIAVFGSGPDTAPVVALARSIGWRADLFTASAVHPTEVAGKVDLYQYDAAIVMTHHFLFDAEILRALAPSPLGYVGLLGPKKRGEELLAETGTARAFDGRLRSPVGLDLGAETPEEIALSIVAEVKAFLAGRTAKPLRETAAPIHDSVPSVLPCA